MDSELDDIRLEAERAARRGNFDEASQHWLRAVALCNDLNKYDHRRIMALEGLANTYWRAGQYADALPIMLKTFSLHEDQLGPDHADIGILANNLARVYHTLEKFSDAEPLYQRALRIRRKVLGVEHPEVAELVKNYANLLVAAGRGFEAEDLKASTVSIKSGIWNRSGYFKTIQLDSQDSLFHQPEPTTAPANLQNPPHQQSEPTSDRQTSHSQASPALDISAIDAILAQSSTQSQSPIQPPEARQDTTGQARTAPPAHYDQSTGAIANQEEQSRTISSAEINAETNELSNWLSARKSTTPQQSTPQAPGQWVELIAKGMEALQQNNTLQAEQTLKYALDATASFDGNDPRIASTLELYSEALWKNGKLTEARPICERTLRFYEANLEPKHQDIGVISNNLAMLYHALDMPELAEPLYKRALEIRSANQGQTHPDVIMLLNNYANMLYIFHREGEAVNMKNYIRSVTSGKWNQVGKFKALSPTAGTSAAAPVADVKQDQFVTYSKFKPSMDQVDWVSQVSDINPQAPSPQTPNPQTQNSQTPNPVAEKTEAQQEWKEFHESKDQQVEKKESKDAKNAKEQIDSQGFSNDPRAVLSRLVDGLLKKPADS